jgi:hypothetical protein
LPKQPHKAWLGQRISLEGDEARNYLPNKAQLRDAHDAVAKQAS